jgi:hypothetical protein
MNFEIKLIVSIHAKNSMVASSTTPTAWGGEAHCELVLLSNGSTMERWSLRTSGSLAVRNDFIIHIYVCSYIYIYITRLLHHSTST